MLNVNNLPNIGQNGKKNPKGPWTEIEVQKEDAERPWDGKRDKKDAVRHHRKERMEV